MVLENSSRVRLHVKCIGETANSRQVMKLTQQGEIDVFLIATNVKPTL